MGQEVRLMPVPVVPIYPGQSLEESDFTMKLFSVNEALRKSYVFERHQVIHMQAVRTLAAGRPVLLRFIRTAEDVRKGQPTKAIYASGTIEIQGLLVPLTGGSAGQVIETRNAASGGIVSALVREDGTLLVVAK
jgi:flagellar basal body P-ring formation protein FlgA